MTSIGVGPYPQDVAVSPDGSLVYATVTGGDTGPGGSDVVAVIGTATNSVTGDITVGTGPRQVVFSPDGDFAYVTTENAIDVIGTATSSVVRTSTTRRDRRASR
jgi:YVTN family beta-propeller protein